MLSFCVLDAVKEIRTAIYEVENIDFAESQPLEEEAGKETKKVDFFLDSYHNNSAFHFDIAFLKEVPEFSIYSVTLISSNYSNLPELPPEA